MGAKPHPKLTRASFSHVSEPEWVVLEPGGVILREYDCPDVAETNDEVLREEG